LEEQSFGYNNNVLVTNLTVESNELMNRKSYIQQNL